MSRILIPNLLQQNNASIETKNNSSVRSGQDIFQVEFTKSYDSNKVQLKTYSTTSNIKVLARSKDQYRTINSRIQFDNDEILEFDSYLVYDNELDRYKKKQIQLIVNLISDNRSDQIKLVGRIRIDLNQFMIDNKGQLMKKQQVLQNCSVNKPDVAKLQYQLELVKEEKINIQAIGQKDSVITEIEKSLFADALEYNEFLREVYGKDYHIQNRLNKSLNQSKLSKSRESSTDKQKIGTKLTPVPIPKQSLLLPHKENSQQTQKKQEKIIPTKNIQTKEPKKPQNKLQTKQQQNQETIQKNKPETKQEKKPEKEQQNKQEKKHQISVTSSKKQNINNKPSTQSSILKAQSQTGQKNQESVTQKKQPQAPIQEVVKEKKQQSPISSASRIPITHTAHEQISSRKSILQSPSHRNRESPSKSLSRKNRLSPIKAQQEPSPTKQTPQQSSNIQSQTQQPQPPNQLTQSMFMQQQQVIEQLQEQLKEAHQIIQRYKLQLQLAKEETQRLETEKGVHVAQIGLSRTRGEENEKTSREHAGLLEASNEEIQQLRVTVEESDRLLEEYKRAIYEKQEIITQKDKTIQSLQSTIQLVTIEYEQKLQQQDQLCNGIHYKLSQAQQEIAYLKSVNEEQKQKIIQRQKQNEEMNAKIIEKQKENTEEKGEIAQREKENLQLNSKIAKQQQEISTLSKTIQQLQEQINTLSLNQDKKTNDQIMHQLHQKDKQLKQHQATISQLQATLQNQRNNFVQLQLKLNDLQTKLDKTHQYIDIYKSNSHKYQQTVKKLTEQKERLQQEMQKTIEKSRQIEKEKYLLGQQITAINLKARSVDNLVEEQVSTYKTQLQQLTLSYEESQNKIAQLKLAVQSYQAALKSQQKKQHQQQEQLTKKLISFNQKQSLLRQSLDQLEKQTLEFKTFVQQKDNHLKELEETILFKDEELEEKNDKLAYLERKLRMAENTVDELKMENKVMTAMYERSQEQGEDQNSKIGLAVLNQANKQLLQKQKMQLQRLNQKDSVIHELQKSLLSIEPLKRQISQLQNKLSSLQKKNKQLTEQLKKLTKTNNDTTSKYKQQTSQLQHVYKQCEEFQQQIRTLEQQRTMLSSEKQQKQLETLHLQSEEEYLRDTLVKVEKKLNQKENKLQETTKLLQRSQSIENQLNKKIRQLTIMLNQNYEFNPSTPTFIDNTYGFEPSPIRPNTEIKEHSQFSNQQRNADRSPQEQEIYRLTEELQAYKQREESYMCNVLDLQEQLEKVKKEKLSLSSSLHEQKSNLKKSQNLQTMSNLDKKDLKIACEQLQRLIEQRIKNRQTENLIQIILSNSEGFTGSQSRASNEEGNLLLKQKNTLQQKSRILSRQMQKIKAVIFKKSELSYKDKTEMIQLLKPCENITNELIKVVEDFAKENDYEALVET